MRKIAILPTLLTLGNAVCGFAALAWTAKVNASDIATESYFALSGWFILAAMVFDALDGYVARLSKSTSKFGAELDSLCDAISFGVAPAFLILRIGPGWTPQPVLHQLLAVIATFYMVCAILRLARFNVESVSAEPGGSKRFRGLPSPGAAGCLASLAILRGELVRKGSAYDTQSMHMVLEAWVSMGGLLVALLMVSRIPFPHLTKQMFQNLRGRHHFSHLVQLLLIVFLFAAVYQLGQPGGMALALALILLFWGYGLGIPLRHALVRAIRHEAFAKPGVSRIDDALPH